MSVLHIIEVVITLMLGLFHVWMWIRRGFWLPRYIHVLALIAFLLGIGTVWLLQSQGLAKPNSIVLILLIFPAIVYGTFIFHGGGAHAPDPQKRSDLNSAE
jgi:hypothetical protein